MKATLNSLRSIARQVGLFAYSLWIFFRILAIRICVRRRLRILMRSGGLGDIIASIPAVNALRRQYGDRYLIYLTRPEFLGICELGLAVHTFLPIYQGDAVVSLLRRFCDVRSLKYLDELPGQHSTRHFVLELAESVGADLQGDDQPAIHVEPISDDEFRAWFGCERKGQRLLAIHTGPTAPVREWSPENWIKLCELLALPDLLIVELGVGRHFLFGGGAQPNPVMALQATRKLSVLESARLLRACDLMIGVDSGPLHLAMAVGIPAAGIFGPVNPSFRISRNALALHLKEPLPCQYCHHQTPRGHWNTGCPNNLACLGTFSVGPVLAQLKGAGKMFLNEEHHEIQLNQ